MLRTSRRSFLKTSAAAALLTGTNAVPIAVHAAEQNTIKIALVGAGGRGTGAAVQALSTAGPTKLVAVADVFENIVTGRVAALTKQQPGKIDVPPERQFAGLDAYKKAIDCLSPGDVVILTTPCGFRPTHVEYAVQKGVHIFMEKPFASDSHGTRRIQAAAKLADEKGIKIACGLMWRHSKARVEAVKRIHDGAIGELIHLRGLRMGGPPNGIRRKNESELAYQIRAFHFFNWAGGDIFIDYCIHNLDVACWAKNALPVSCFALGARSVPDVFGQVFDTVSYEYTFPDGTHLSSYGRYRPGCFTQYSDFVHGTKGSAYLMDRGRKVQLFSDQSQSKESVLWTASNEKENPYQDEHDLLFDAIRNDKPYNEGHRAADANFTSLMGRAAMYSGQIVTRRQVEESKLALVPNIDTLTMDSEAPVKPNPDGTYPHAIPGTAENCF